MKEVYPAIAAIAVTVLSFLMFFMLPYSRLANNVSPANQGLKTVYKTVFERIAGFIVLGILPLISYIYFIEPVELPGIKLPGKLWFFIVLGCILIIIPVAYKNAATAQNLKIYPQIRISEWNATIVLVNTTTWIIYLLSYEYILRGFLFFKTLPIYGFLGSAAINSAIYALAHLPKGRKETLAAIPFGFILCALTYYSGSFWIAFLLHVCLAIANDMFSVQAHPEMQFKYMLKIFNKG